MTRILLAALAFVAVASPVAAAEIACKGPFAADSSAARLIETYGRDNVVTGEVPGPEGSTVIATTVFPNDPAKMMEFGWWDEEKFERVAYFTLPADDTAPGGLKPGLTVREVEALNGAPFVIGGFWWDYGGGADFSDGKLAEAEGGCHVSVRFSPMAEIPENLDVTAISGEVSIPSDTPLLEQLDTRVESVTIGYPDFSAMED